MNSIEVLSAELSRLEDQFRSRPYIPFRDFMRLIEVKAALMRIDKNRKKRWDR